MHLSVNSESIVCIKMSTLESQDNQEMSELINDLKEGIPSNIKDDLKVKDEEISERASVVSILAKGEADIVEVKPEIQLNGRGEDEIISNGAPDTPNSDKENDAPKDSETVVEVENKIENTANSTKSIEDITKNQVTTYKMDTGNDNASSTQDDINSEIYNKPTVNDSESEAPGKQPLDDEKIASEITNTDNAKTLNEEPLENNELGDAELTELASDSRNSVEISAAENTEHNPLTISENEKSCIVTKEMKSVDSKEDTQEKEFNSSQMEIDVSEDVENSSKDELDNSAIVESNGQLELPAETIGKQNGSTNIILKDFNATDNVSIDEQNDLLEPEDQEKGEIGDLKMSETQKETLTDDDKKNNENTNPSEENTDPVFDSILLKASEDKINDNDKPTPCRKDIKTETEDKTVVTEENKTESKNNENIANDKAIDNSISDATPISIESKCDIKTENEMTVDVSQNEPKSKPIDDFSSNLPDKKSNEITVKTEVLHNDGDPNESETVVENPVVENQKNTDCVSVSSMEVDDVSQNEPKSKPIDDFSSNLSDKKSNEITVKTEVLHNDGDPNESETVIEKPVVKKLKYTDCVSVSSMEVDDVEIVPTEKVKTEISNNQNVAMDISVTNDEDNVIEIFDQDVVESTDNVKSEKESEMNLDSKKDQPSTKTEAKLEDKVDISDEDDIKIVENTETKTQTPKNEEPSVESKPLPVVCKLSNTLDILSDEEDEPPSKISKVEETKPEPEEKQCINIDDDDDIMLIEDTKETTAETAKAEKEEPHKNSDKVNDETAEKEASKSVEDPTSKINEEEPITTDIESPKVSEKEASPPKESSKPLLPINFLKSAKKNLAEMTRDELEEFCILKIVEGIVDRSSLSDIKSKMKTIEKNMEEYRKKAMVLSKQNRDLQVVLKSVQEEQKNRPNTAITPLKITRSVGMQVLMLDKGPKKKPPPPQNTNVNTPKPITRNMVQPARPQKTPSNQNIPVPRLIPASPAKTTPSSPVTTIVKPQTPNGIRNTVSPAQKAAEKRPMTRQAATSSNMTVDLTDDEPPAKVNKSSPVPPVRLVPSQNLMAPLRGQMQTNNPRKVFIPINGQGHNLIRGQTAVMLKSVPQSVGPRQRLPSMPRMPSNSVRINVNRHPAPLPDVMKQYQPPTWKALPPAPDLKLSKVENGIVISWKIEGYQEDSYEKIASYQLYAYQETSTPPSTALWKKIGDVKALPLPMACTLTQFMAGFKYYFAVRAVDVKSRLGPFSLPGSILLLNKM